MTWNLILHSIPEGKVETLLEYCRLAEAKDPTFKFTVEEDENGKIRYVIIECESKDHAFKRGMLFYYKFHVFFEVEYEDDKAKIHR